MSGRLRVILYNIEINQDGSVTQRRHGPGLVLVGGGLQADLVVPALHDAELCELQLPATDGQPIKVTALVEGMRVNGKELRQKQTISAMSHDIHMDGISIKLAAAEPAVVPLAEKPADRLVSWLDNSKQVVSTRDVAGLVQRNPAPVMFGAAALLALIAFLVSGWPSAKFKPELGGKMAVNAPNRENMLSMLAEIRRRLTSADLGYAIKAEPSGNAIRLTGTADPAQARRLDEIVKLVSTTGSVPLRNDVAMTSADAATGIEAVVTSPSHAVILSGGRMVTEGQTIPSGWLIEKISPGQVTLQRDSVTHVIAMSEVVPPGASAAMAGKPAALSEAQGAGRPAARPPAQALEAISSPPQQIPVMPSLAPIHAPAFNSMSAQQRVIYK